LVQQTTSGITIKVETAYQANQSDLANSEYIFAYRITIVNNNKQAVQLLSRVWQIVDGCGQIRKVEGLGVVGEQPVIKPFESYVYTSACQLPTEVGKMSGYYNMIDLYNHQNFIVTIPSFQLVAPFIHN
jgi:ApaG protein